MQHDSNDVLKIVVFHSKIFYNEFDKSVGHFKRYNKNDFKKIGGICTSLTGVITPSTAVAHLAAAVGKSTIIIENTRTWLPIINDLDAFLPCIKRIFPPNTGDWEWVFNGVRKELNNWLSNG